MAKRVYLFNEGGKEDRELLGSKGANLCEMTAMGLPVPYGFVITTPTCREFFASQLPQKIAGRFLKAEDHAFVIFGGVFVSPIAATVVGTHVNFAVGDNWIAIRL